MEKRDVIGAGIVDSEGFELGYIQDEDKEYYMLGEGLVDEFWVHKSLFEAKRDGTIALKETIYEIFYEATVYDKANVRIGKVVEITESGDVLDTIIIDRLEDGIGAVWDKEEDRHLYLTLEEIDAIKPHIVYLNTTYEELKFHNHPHVVRKNIWDKVRHLFEL